jgi:putative FmdB family regulatory protein
MPIYEYHCPKCGTFETTQRITEPALKRCPTCKSKVERMISATSFVLKGSGWYATDYARSGSAKATDGSNEKSESKPAAESASNGTNGSSSAAAGSSDKVGSSDKSGSSDKGSGSSSEKSAKTKSSD